MVAKRRVIINFVNLDTPQHVLVFLWNDGQNIIFKKCLLSHLSILLVYGILVHTKMQELSNNLYYFHVLVSWISAEKPYSNSCNPPRWRGPSIQPLRMHQCPQMPAQSQNTDGESLGVISHSVIILFRNMDFVSRSSNWLLSGREEENILKYEFGLDM